mmetsp:Transcript_2669/g.7371  ORF Transcript_2669/g.7371 Transcript_2669/m.7371 type:complete len:205 (+) Transcript_2669:603-1217(+)
MLRSVKSPWTTPRCSICSAALNSSIIKGKTISRGILDSPGGTRRSLLINASKVVPIASVMMKVVSPLSCTSFSSGTSPVSPMSSIMRRCRLVAGSCLRQRPKFTRSPDADTRACPQSVGLESPELNSTVPELKVRAQLAGTSMLFHGAPWEKLWTLLALIACNCASGLRRRGSARAPGPSLLPSVRDVPSAPTPPCRLRVAART